MFEPHYNLLYFSAIFTNIWCHGLFFSRITKLFLIYHCCAVIYFLFLFQYIYIYIYNFFSMMSFIPNYILLIKYKRLCMLSFIIYYYYYYYYYYKYNFFLYHMSLFCRRGMLGHRLTKIRINRWCHIMLYTLGSLGSLMITTYK